MTSEKQIQANKQNALLGGVKTPAGKAVSRYNALKHGLLSKEVLLAGEDEEALLELGKRLRQDLKPVSEIEFLLVDRIIANLWRLKRLLSVEKNLMEWQKNHSGFSVNIGLEMENDETQKTRRKIINTIVNNEMEQILRYETTIEKTFNKALHELQRIQASRKGEKPPVPIAIDLDITGDK